MIQLLKSRHRRRVHALIVGLALLGQIHLFSVEVFHNHDVFLTAVQSPSHLASPADSAVTTTPFCPICQVVRSSSVRPAVQSVIQKPDQQADYHPAASQARRTLVLATTLLARAPPLS